MKDTKRDHPAGAVDPAQAFEALRKTVADLHGEIEAQNRHLDAELAIIRKSIESAFEQLAAIQEPVDYGPDIARMVESLDGVSRRLKAIEKSPFLQRGPHESARIMTAAGEEHIRSAVRTLATGTRNVINKTPEIGRHMRHARNHTVYFMNKWNFGEIQDCYIAATILVFTLGGLFSSVLLPAVLYRYLWVPISQWVK